MLFKHLPSKMHQQRNLYLLCMQHLLLLHFTYLKLISCYVKAFYHLLFTLLEIYG